MNCDSVESKGSGDAGLSYRDAGVDLDAAERAKEGLRDLIARTRDDNTLSELGSFGGLYQVPAHARHPVLVSSADGVGTKLKLAFMTDRHDTVGQDLVNHCVNDILVQGARPMFFLDYLATGVLDESVVHQVVAGIATACAQNGCALLGGETAQMPDFYAADEYDLAGFIVGMVEREAVLDGSGCREGDRLLAVASSGLHTNGYTLARRVVFERMGLRPDDRFPGETDSVGDVLMRVHRSYLGSVGPHLDRIVGMAHITGGGIPGNLPRTLPRGLGATVDRATWSVPNLFQVLGDRGGVDREEMFRVFNMGVGLVLVVRPDQVDTILSSLRESGEVAWECGRVVDGSGVAFVS